MAFIGLEKLINFTPGYRKVFRIDQLKILLINNNGKPFIIDASCPHQQWSLLDADIKEDKITCSLHQARFSLNTGEVIKACHGLGNKKLKVYQVHYEGNQIGINLI